MSAIDLPSGIKTLNPVPVDFWSGPYTGADETAAILAANTTIPSSVRFPTMEVRLIISGIGYKYWYKDGITDLDLVKVDTDISNLVTLNTNQTITGEKTFNGGDLKLQGYDNLNAISLTYAPSVGTGTAVFPDASGGTAKTIAYRDWVTSQGYITSNAVNSVNGQTGVVVLTTSDISEGSNLYYTSTRANNDFDTRFATKTTSDLTEGTNLYYTNTRFNTDFASKTTTDLGEGSNLYFTNGRAIGATLTGYSSGAGTISSSDTILQAIQKLNGNIAGLTTGVSSVFGRTGAVTATIGDYNTSQVTENTNLYFTDARARASISLTTSGTSGAATYNSTTGVLNIPQYQGGVTSFNTRTGAITLTSTDVTDALTFTPYNASNPNNYIPLTALSSTATGLTYTNTTGVFSLTSGYVIPTTTQETDWNTGFTNRITSLTTTGNSGAATLISNTLNIPQYTLSGLGGDNASNITSGTLSDSRLSSNVVLLDVAQTITSNKVTTGLFTARANGLAATQDLTKGIRLENLTATTSVVPLQNSPSLYLRGNVWNTGPTTGGISAGDNLIEWGINTSGLSGNTVNNMDAYLDINMRWGSNSSIRVARFTKSGLETNLFQNTLTLGQPGDQGQLILNRSSGGSIGTITGKPSGLQIASNYIFLETSGYIQLGSTNNGSRFSVTTGLLLQSNGNAAANSASRLSVLGNASIGENVAAPTNGLRVLGNTLLQANTFIGGTTTPTARVHIAASTSTASEGQLKLIGGGTRQTVAENGTINNIGGNLEFVDASVVYTLAKTLTNTATLDFPSTNGGATSDLTITVTGAVSGDVVSLGVPAASATDGLFFAFVSAADTVTIRFHNHTGTPVDPASGVFRVSIIKY